MADDLDPRAVRLRAWFGNLTMEAEGLLERGAAPSWIADTINPGRVRNACRKAGLPRVADKDIRALVLALAMAIEATTPRPHAEIRKRIHGLRKRAQTLLYLLEEERLERDVLQSLWGGFISETLPDGTIVVAWDYDAAADLRAALRTFIERASSPDLPAHPGGLRPERTTLAAVALAGIALEHNADVSAAALARLAADLFDEVLDHSRSRQKPRRKRPSDARQGSRPRGPSKTATGAPRRDVESKPDWHDRISQALAEHQKAL